MPDDSTPASTPTGYQRTTGGNVRWQPPTVEHLQALFPQYEILELLGHGGMGAVYKARQLTLDRLVAIKILPPEAADDGEANFVERFKNEARTMARLDHPAIVHVHDFGETAEGQLYFVMQFVEGTDVQKMVKSSGRLPAEHALAIAAHVCDALTFAHSHGVIHRDIKPANVLIDMEGAVKVADFGLAKATEDGHTQGLTATGTAMGTPDYVAPETLVLGMNADHRADLYALGVMLYHMLTGEMPRGNWKLASQKVGSDVRFDAIIDRAMETDREERYQSAVQIRQDLDKIITMPMMQSGGQSSAAIPKQSLPQKPVARGPQRMTGSADSPARHQTIGGGAAKLNEADKTVRAPSKPWLVPAALAGVAVLGLGSWFALKSKWPAQDSAQPTNNQAQKRRQMPILLGSEALMPAGVDTPAGGMQDKSMTIPARPSRGKGRPVAVVRQGSAAVPIYKGDVRGSNRFTVAFYRNGRRERRTFGTLDAARDEARTVALNIQRGMSSDNDLRPQDREAFKAACAMIEPFGIPLLTALDDYVRCRRKLGERPLMTSVEEFVRRTKGFTAGVLMPRVVEEFLAAKVQDRMSRQYLKSLQSILRRFAKALSGEIARVTTQQIDAWLRSGDYSTVTRNNRLKRVKLLFSYGRQCGYLPKNEPTAAEGIKHQKQGETDVGIFKPEQMEQLLRAAPARLIPVLAIGAFAGLRAAEIARLDWSAVNLERRIIELRAGQAKTASRRIVPISDNLAAWLSPLPREGRVVPENVVFVKITKLAKELGINWPHNALRHSYISYRIAVVQSAAQVALEAGNSPAIIFRHYRELVTEDEAKQWFGIMPTTT